MPVHRRSEGEARRRTKDRCPPRQFDCLGARAILRLPIASLRLPQDDPHGADPREPRSLLRNPQVVRDVERVRRRLRQNGRAGSTRVKPVQ